MSRYTHAALLGLLLVSCRKEPLAQKKDAPASNPRFDALFANAAPRDDETPAPPCAATNPRDTFVPVGESGNGTLALLRWHRTNGTQTLAIAADEDENALQVVDVDSRSPLGTTKLSGKPARILVTGDGRIIVSLSDTNMLEVLEPTPESGFPLKHRCTIETPAEPMGLAITKDQKTLLVTTRWEPTLSIYDAMNMSQKNSLDLPRDPTTVLASNDGKRAFVMHAAGGMMSVVDLEGSPEKPDKPTIKSTALTTNQFTNRSFGMPMAPIMSTGRPKDPFPHKVHRVPTVKHQRIGSQGFVLARSEKNIFAPLVMVEPTPPRGSSSGYGSAEASSPAVVGEVATIDEKTGAVQMKQGSMSVGPKDCFLPRAASYDETMNELYVTCLGIDNVVVYDGSKKHPHDYEKRRIAVPGGPTGLVIDSDKRRAVVFSSFAGAMTFVTLETPQSPSNVGKVAKMTTKRVSKKKRDKNETQEVVSMVLPGRKSLPDQVALGRTLFHASGRRNVALDGRVCASCHPDGRDDGLTWQTQEGPRQTPILLGRLSSDTAPFGWLGDKTTLPSHFKRTIERLAGTGLKDPERDAIFAYV
ncbi:MAG TPA: cytochrome C peroxidase, partial [Polyangium sp.]|nr:cytochrome C peroxidase [Polyangium sp.]